MGDMSDERARSEQGVRKPEPPNPDDYGNCCDSGCSPCVFDLYWEAQARYEAALVEWQACHAGKNT